MRLVETVHEALAAVLLPGDFAIDATAGNGHDVAFLAKLVGVSGKVHAFDLQRAALATTEEKLRRESLLERCTLHHGSHQHMAEVLPSEMLGRTRAIVFNLGYLPGGDKSIVTTASSTLPALETATRWLAANGLLTVTAYRGHLGGMEETNDVEQLLTNLPVEDFVVSMERPSTDTTAPIAYLVRKGRGA
jgi:hypothetical protein